MTERDGSLCAVCNRLLSTRDQAAYRSHCEDCWCAGPSGIGDLRYSGGPYPLPVVETRGRPAQVVGAKVASACYT
jgi:hypothetical protein